MGTSSILDTHFKIMAIKPLMGILMRFLHPWDSDITLCNSNIDYWKTLGNSNSDFCTEVGVNHGECGGF